MDWLIVNMYIRLFLEGHRRTWENQQISGHKVSTSYPFHLVEVKLNIVTFFLGPNEISFVKSVTDYLL